ncbi:hypothetical protein DRN97_00205 [Methanosarcinales archaeon]|nr:MAG: hypothetical protein DRN97_00205 [Methanosarcinales archaeon]
MNMFLLSKQINNIMCAKYTKKGIISEEWLAEEITKAEGKKESVNIAQVKEVLRITLDILASLEEDDISLLLKKHRRE